MEKLKRFSKSNKKKSDIKLILAFILVVIVSATISYAVYQKEDEVLFINAKVGQFETSSSDIELAMKLDGEEVDVPPSKSDGYYNVTVECDHADGRWDEEEWGAIIINISSNRVKCNVNFETLETRPLSIVEVGDYISMTPTSTSYTPPSNLTGLVDGSKDYEGRGPFYQNTINPSELNLWRVISKNDDGTVDVVSEYVSSKAIYFYSQAGYMNLVGGLNIISRQYTNEKYVSKTRHMGYNNQIENCASLSSCPADTEFEIDTNLVQESINTLVGKDLSGNAKEYYLASRWRPTVADPYGLNRANYITSSGLRGSFELFIVDGARNYGEAKSVRPVLTLKSDIEIVSGDGQSAATAYIFE